MGIFTGSSDNKRISAVAGSNLGLWPGSHFHGQSHYQGSKDRILLMPLEMQQDGGIANENNFI